MNKKLLWVGDGGVPTGFECVSRNVLTELQRHGWDVVQLAINFNGDAVTPLPWPMYRAAAGGDLLGIQRLSEVWDAERPDITLVLGDPWIVRYYLPQVPPEAKIVAYVPVDAPNQWAAAELNRLNALIAYTTFGARELRVGGYVGPLEIIPHGVDAEFFHPMPTREAREALGMPEPLLDAVIFGNVNRNQPRKRLDLTLSYFAKWWHEYGRPDDAYLLFHCALQDQGWDLKQLGEYYGIDNRLIFTGSQNLNVFSPPERLRHVYNSLDVQVSTSLGEGWGLTTHEGMACGRPQIVPGHSAFNEWAPTALWRVACRQVEVLAGGVNTLGGVADEAECIQAFDLFYHAPSLRASFGGGARIFAKAPQYSWQAVGAQFNDVLQRSL